jgi:hypothetical protein
VGHGKGRNPEEMLCPHVQADMIQFKNQRDSIKEQQKISPPHPYKKKIY